MKLLIIRLIKLIYIFFIYLKIKNRFNNKSEIIYIFDLDNTIYNTWPYVNKINKNLYIEIPIFNGMKEQVNSLSKKGKVVFLSARNLRFIFQTKKRLKLDFPTINFQLILVDQPKDKLKYLKFFISNTSKVFYYDDLSYNHENNDLKLYNNTINEVLKLPVEYYGLEVIKNINKC